MLAACAVRLDRDDPLAGLEVMDRPDPIPPPGWTTVTVQAAALNHHDLWSLQGVGLSEERLPMVLGCDAAGVAADGREVVVHAVIGDPAAGRSGGSARGRELEGDETLDPDRSLLSERHDGTLAERVCVPVRNLVDKPADLSFEEAACLPTAWLTAYRMLTRDSGLSSGDTVLVQGAGGGVATAAVVLGKALDLTVWVTSRDPAKGKRALALGADEVFESGARLPSKVDAVIETVGRATWSHSLRALRPGGTIVVSGATSGDDPAAELRRVFFLQLRIVGSTMGTRDELESLVSLVVGRGIHPPIDAVFPLSDTRAALEKMAGGELFGKIVVLP